MSDTWYYTRSGQQLGPVPFQQLQAMVGAGQLMPADMVWKDGMPDWVQAGTVPALFPPAQPMPGPGYMPQPPYPQAPYQQGPYAPQPTHVPNYYAPPPRGYAAQYDDGSLSGGDWALIVLCSGIACIIGIVRLIQGKRNAGKMIGFSLLFVVIWNIIRFGILAAQQ